MSRRLIALLILAIGVLTACGRAASTQPASGGYRLFLEQSYTDGAERITVLDAGTGTVERTLPIGTASPDWSRYYTVTDLPGNGRVSAIDPSSGRTIAQTTIPAGYALPNLGNLGPTSGLSPNGQWLTLTDNGRSVGGKLVTSFLVGPSSLSSSFKTMRLDGAFSFDALSNDGQNLYLIQKMGDPNHYQVRLYQVGSGGPGSLIAQPVVDKRDAKEPMNGIRGDSVADPTGNFVYTVYVRNTGPFVHALPLGSPIAWCIDLPTKAPNGLDQQLRWSLAVSRDGQSVYAANAALGTVAVISGDPPQVGRTASVLGHPAYQLGQLGGIVTSADAKGAQIGGAALSADGRTLFTFGETGVLAVDTTTLKVRAHYLDPWRPDAMRMSADGALLYVAESGESKLWQINPLTGAVADIKGVTNPWALLWAAPK